MSWPTIISKIAVCICDIAILNAILVRLAMCGKMDALLVFIESDSGLDVLSHQMVIRRIQRCKFYVFEFYHYVL